MDVRAWIEQQVEIAVSGEDDILRQRMHIVNVLAPTITKLVEAVQACVVWEEEYRTINNLGKTPPFPFEMVRNAIAELEKP